MEELRAIIRSSSRGGPTLAIGVVLIALGIILGVAEIASAAPPGVAAPTASELAQARSAAAAAGPCAALVPQERAQCAARRASEEAARREVTRRSSAASTSLDSQWNKAVERTKQPQFHRPGLRMSVLILGIIGAFLAFRRERARWRRSRAD